MLDEWWEGGKGWREFAVRVKRKASETIKNDLQLALARLRACMRVCVFVCVCMRSIYACVCSFFELNQRREALRWMRPARRRSKPKLPLRWHWADTLISYCVFTIRNESEERNVAEITSVKTHYETHLLQFPCRSIWCMWPCLKKHVNVSERERERESERELLPLYMQIKKM